VKTYVVVIWIVGLTAASVGVTWLGGYYGYRISGLLLGIAIGCGAGTWLGYAVVRPEEP